jgi:hypothetical protein
MASFALQKSAAFSVSAKASTSRARTVRVQAAAANHTSWFPGSKLPAHLDGGVPGDYGFDPLSLGEDALKLRWYQQAELVHCRFAMLGAVGILVPDMFKSIGMGGDHTVLHTPSSCRWWESYCRVLSDAAHVIFKIAKTTWSF